ncbi:hypothetical protein MUU72_03440 [Streptomyces sp. RS10V-4]|uniref:baeRF2 domain-containing protein n=1 Tax=Streptomyces rhizoryzae TaxID=2932493 RepID=UPI0020051062|nr:hypothetical protein [Streptomyces rhizoryzae]MCK7622187.1 hypothetical protein [Streptomyces rhizoryzae]
MEAVRAAADGEREVAGRHGRMIVASRGRVLLAEELPEPPARDEAAVTGLPDLLPLAVQYAPGIRYVAAGVYGTPGPRGGPPDVVEVVFQAGTWPSSAVAPGACYRMRSPAAGRRLNGAGPLADGIAGLARGSGAEAIVLGGIDWARDALADQLAARWRKRLVIGGDTPAPGGDGSRPDPQGTPLPPPGRALMEPELAEVFRDGLRTADAARLELFQARRPSRHGAVEGVADVVAALQRSQVATLLLNVPLRFPARRHVSAWVTAQGLPEAAPAPYGLLGFREGPVGAAVLRAAVCTGAELVVVPRHHLALSDGLGALLRYAGPERTPHFSRPARR